MTEKLKGWGAIVVSVLTFGVLAWWLVVVATHIGDSPVVVDGAVALDTFQRSKDILLVVLPLATTAVGYWLGNQGADKAEESAQAAVQDARRSSEIATDSEQQMHVFHARALLAEQKMAVIRAAAEGGGPRSIQEVVYAMLREEDRTPERSELAVADNAPSKSTGSATLLGDDDF